MQTEKIFYTAFLAGIILLFLTPFVLAQSDVTEQEFRDAILGKSQQDLQKLDVNNDGKVDVADLVHCIKSGMCSGEPASLTGEHVGILLRDNAVLIEGQSEVYGQIPFALKITGESPLKGEIDNRSDSELGHYSLYFPNKQIPITFLNGAEEFSFEFTTANSKLAPGTELSRSITFKGEFSDTGTRVLAGTYEESIAGFKDNRGADIPITLTGTFMIVLSAY